MSDDKPWEPGAETRVQSGSWEQVVAAVREGGLFLAGTPRIFMTEDGVQIDFPTNAADTGKLMYLGLQIRIPVKVQEQALTFEPVPDIQNP